jgi:hypothetical protein
MRGSALRAAALGNIGSIIPASSFDKWYDAKTGLLLQRISINRIKMLAVVT